MEWKFRASCPGETKELVGYAEIASRANRPEYWMIKNVYVIESGIVRLANYDEHRAVSSLLHSHCSTAIGSAFRKTLEHRNVLH